VFVTLDEMTVFHCGTSIGVDDGAGPMVGVSDNFGLECQIDIYLVVVTLHSGDQVRGVVYWYDVASWVSWMVLLDDCHPWRCASGERWCCFRFFGVGWGSPPSEVFGWGSPPSEGCQAGLVPLQ
jgi:hypothetical protein